MPYMVARTAQGAAGQQKIQMNSDDTARTRWLEGFSVKVSHALPSPFLSFPSCLEGCFTTGGVSSPYGMYIDFHTLMYFIRAT